MKSARAPEQVLALPRRSGRRRPAPRGRRGARRTVAAAIRQIPSYLRLLAGLMLDRRVSLLDKLLVGAAIAYVVSPVDLIPDFIPFVGEVDDVFVLMLALQHLIAHAGAAAVDDHWDGDPEAIGGEQLRDVLVATSFFLPRRIRRRLRRLARV